MAIETTPFDPADHLTSHEAQVELLNDALASGHAGYIANAVGIIARARGMTELAEATDIRRQSLYTALSATGNPTLETLMKVSNALGIRFVATLGEPVPAAA